MMFAPLESWRHVKVTDRHAAVDYAQWHYTPKHGSWLELASLPITLNESGD